MEALSSTLKRQIKSNRGLTIETTRESALTGVYTMFDFAGCMKTRVVRFKRGSLATDVAAMRYDWKKVGQDMHRAIER